MSCAHKGRCSSPAPPFRVLCVRKGRLGAQEARSEVGRQQMVVSGVRTCIHQGLPAERSTQAFGVVGWAVVSHSVLWSLVCTHHAVRP